MYSSELYMSEIGNLKIEETSQQLSKKVKEGDFAAKQKLLQMNLKLVVKIAMKHTQISDEPLEDLISEGNLGLLRAIETYDPDISQFTTYASNWITGYILRYIKKYGEGIVHTQLNKNFSREKIKNFVSFDEISELGIEHYFNMTTEINVNQIDSKYILERLFSNITQKEISILYRKFVYGESPERISKDYNVTRQRIDKIIKVALKKLKDEGKQYGEIDNRC
jgi:RNA polymerase sigma factor (sigma-70 family)